MKLLGPAKDESEIELKKRGNNLSPKSFLPPIKDGVMRNSLEE